MLTYAIVFYTVYFTIYVLASSYTGATAHFTDPMVLVHYSIEKYTYTLRDLDTIRSTTFKTDAKIIFLCPCHGDIRGGYEVFFKIKKIISSDSVGQIAKEDEWCDASPLLLEWMRPSVYASYENDVYRVTYIIPNDQDTEDLLKAHQLSDGYFPNFEFRTTKVSNSWLEFYEIYGIEVTFDATQLAVRSTFHPIGKYNTAKEEQKLQNCNHPLFGVGGIRGDNILQKFGEGNFSRTIEDKVLVPHQLVPIDDFTNYYSRLATCTYINIVPIWQEISEGPLRRIERYIQRVAKELPIDTIRIRDVAYDTLQLRTGGNFKLAPVFVDDQTRRIPVPKLLLKIIFYRIPRPGAEYSFIGSFHDHEEDLNMVIVIHNEMGKDNIEKVCDNGEKYCEENGWYVTDNENYANVYCCSLSHRFFKEIPGSKYSWRYFERFNLEKVQLEKGGEYINVTEKLGIIKNDS